MRLLLILLLTLNLLQAKKIALLIGNSDYNFAPLANPLNDVDGIYQTLKEIGFDISRKDVLKNASQTQMQQALAKFSQRASSAEIALVYFSGHGMQVGNTNYMLPAKTHPQKPVDLYGLVDLDYFIQSASSAKYGIILVDACRNNPLVKYFQNGKHKGDSAKKGLGKVTPKSGQVVIGFATSAGDTADDGNGDMSPYAKALSKRLKTPNKDITKVLGLVALDVSAKYEQNPIYRANLAYDVFLNKNYKKFVDISKAKVEAIKKINFTTKAFKRKEVTIIDGLMYQNQPFSYWDTRYYGGYGEERNIPHNRVHSYEGAKKYCQELNLNDYKDWRLPQGEELERLGNIELYGYSRFWYTYEGWFDKYKSKRLKNSRGYSYFVREDFLENMPDLVSNIRLSASFWHFSALERHRHIDPDSMWILDFLTGKESSCLKEMVCYVLCVRDITDK